MARLTSIKPRLGVMKSRLGSTPENERERSRTRDDEQKWRKWYKTARWQKLRLAVLRRDAVDISTRSGVILPRHVLFNDSPLLWPVCQQTGEVLIGKHPAPNSPVVDHVRPHRGDPALFWGEGNLQTVSKTYHDRQKQSLEKRGLI